MPTSKTSLMHTVTSSRRVDEPHDAVAVRRLAVADYFSLKSFDAVLEFNETFGHFVVDPSDLLFYDLA